MSCESQSDFRPAPRASVFGPDGPASAALRQAAGRRKSAAADKIGKRAAARLINQWSSETVSSPDMFGALAFAADPSGFVALAAAGKDPGGGMADRAAAASPEAVRAACPYRLDDGLRGRALADAVSRGVAELRGATLAYAAGAVSVQGSPAALAALAACVASGASVVICPEGRPPSRVEARGLSGEAWLHDDRGETSMKAGGGRPIV